jgi:hypothetical protein
MSKKAPAEEDKTGTVAKDESRDRIYYTITPRLVWALSEDPFDLALWMVVKDIAGENGSCILAREDLAALAMMSEGMVSKSRDRLISKKLLNGKLQRDPGYPQEVWHLTIPDFWEANVRWARMYPTIRSRVEFKKAQKSLRKGIKESSPHDGLKESSLHDEGVSLHDEGVSLYDVKNNVLEKPKEEVKEEELKNLFLNASETVFPDVKDRATLEKVTSELQEARYSLEDRLFTVSGIPIDRAGYYQDLYKKYFERAFVGLVGSEVSIEFSSGEHVPA